MAYAIFKSLLPFLALVGRGDAHPAPVTLQPRAAETERPNYRPFNASVYIPVAVLTVVLLFLIVGILLRRRVKERSASRAAAATATGQTSATAEQLAANRTAAATTQNGANASGTAPRRPRRNRRRPSQMSVTSLPLYNEEADATELVLVRGERDMQDDQMPDGEITRRMSDDSSPSSSHDFSNRDSSYLSTPRDEVSRQSYESVDVDSDGSDHNHRRQPMGPTPTYEEALQHPLPPPHAAASTSRTQSHDFREARQNEEGQSDAQGDGNGEQTVRAGPSNANHESTSTSRNAAASSGTRKIPMPNLRNLFTRAPSSSTRRESSASTHGRPGSRTHLLSHQRSTSTFSTASTLGSDPIYSNPSASRVFQHPNGSIISLASISSPLSHTLTRTEFSYPRTGPTPEQMKFLGSRESLGLFGVPWGEAAIRYAQAEPPPFTPSTRPSTGYTGNDLSREVSRDSNIDGLPPVASGSSHPLPLPPTPRTPVVVVEEETDSPSDMRDTDPNPSVLVRGPSPSPLPPPSPPILGPSDISTPVVPPIPPPTQVSAAA